MTTNCLGFVRGDSEMNMNYSYNEHTESQWTTIVSWLLKRVLVTFRRLCAALRRPVRAYHRQEFASACRRMKYGTFYCRNIIRCLTPNSTARFPITWDMSSWRAAKRSHGLFPDDNIHCYQEIFYGYMRSRLPAGKHVSAVAYSHFCWKLNGSCSGAWNVVLGQW
jgi:hypothetical protein